MSAVKKHKWVVPCLELKLEVLTWPTTVPSLNTDTGLTLLGSHSTSRQQVLGMLQTPNRSYHCAVHNQKFNVGVVKEVGVAFNYPNIHLSAWFLECQISKGLLYRRY